MTRVVDISTGDQLFAAGDRLGRCELVRGGLIMMTPAGGRHGEITMRLAFKIAQHVEANQLGRAYAAKTGFLLEREPDSVRAPDIAYVATPRLVEADTEVQ